MSEQLSPPDLTQHQKLDLAEGRRLLEEKQRLEPGIRRAPRAWQDLDATAGFAHAAFMVWLQDNASALLDAAAERDRLRERELPHYYSTACLHERCDLCRQKCKYCASLCLCGCHNNDAIPRFYGWPERAALSPAAPEEQASPFPAAKITEGYPFDKEEREAQKRVIEARRRRDAAPEEDRSSCLTTPQ